MPLSYATQPADEGPFVGVADAIRQHGYVVLNDILPRELLQGLLDEVRNTDETDFRRAGIGRDTDFQLNKQVRSDSICWVDEQAGNSTGNDSLRRYFDWIEDLRLYLNRELLLGLFDYECHYAYYPVGAFYKKHLDAFRGQSNRRLSTVLYLNPSWQPDWGGELALYDEAGQQLLLKVSPAFGTLVLFLSEIFPHEVLPTRMSRYSLTGWFRINETDSQTLALQR